MATAKTAAKPKPAKEGPTKQNFKNYPSLSGQFNRPKAKSPNQPGPAQETPATQVADAPAATMPPPAQAPAGVRMPTINDVRVAGRLTREPVFRDVGNQRVANFDIAVQKFYRDAKNQVQKQVSFVPVAIWGMVADRAKAFLHKGSPVYLEGRLRSNNWQTKDGQNRSMLRLEAFKIQSLARAQSRSQGQEIGD
jgi:single-strand DNA-binding protein